MVKRQNRVNDPARYAPRHPGGNGKRKFSLSNLLARVAWETNRLRKYKITYSAQQFINSPAFMNIALEDALKAVAKANNQTVEAARNAFALEVPNVVQQVAKLVTKSAQHCADEANAGRLWA